jgi:hypothetical protein
MRHQVSGTSADRNEKAAPGASGSSLKSDDRAEQLPFLADEPHRLQLLDRREIGGRRNEARGLDPSAPMMWTLPGQRR